MKKSKFKDRMEVALRAPCLAQKKVNGVNHRSVFCGFRCDVVPKPDAGFDGHPATFGLGEQ
jgi:hypothetical protein